MLYSPITPIGHCRGVALITRHVSLNSKVYSAPSSLALLLLLAWSGAAIGATAVETRCDQSVRASDMPETRPTSFSIDVVDHGPVRPSRQIGGPPKIEIDTEELGESVEIVLRRIFDEPRLRPVDTSNADNLDDIAAPMAVDQGETVEESASESESDDARKTSARLPGVSEDELMRFKRQMYRKDI